MSAGTSVAGTGAGVGTVCSSAPRYPRGGPCHLLRRFRRPRRRCRSAPAWRPGSAARSSGLSRRLGRGGGSVVGRPGHPGRRSRRPPAPGRRPRRGSGVGHQRQDHHDQPAAGRPWPPPGRSSPTPSAPTSRPGWPPPSAAGPPGRGRRPRGRRGLAGPGGGRHRARGRWPAQPEPRPARSQQRGPPAGDHLAAHVRARPAPSTVVVANADDPLVVWGAGVRRRRALGRCRPALDARRVGLPALWRSDPFRRRRRWACRRATCAARRSTSAWRHATVLGPRRAADRLCR